MASIGFLIGQTFIIALAFSGSNFLFSSLSKESTEKERKRHDKAFEDLQRTQIKWAKKRQERLDYINNEIMKERKAKKSVGSQNHNHLKQFPPIFRYHLQITIIVNYQ